MVGTPDQFVKIYREMVDEWFASGRAEKMKNSQEFLKYIDAAWDSEFNPPKPKSD